MASVTSEEFRSRVLLTKSLETSIETELNSTFYCNVCRKQFGNEKAFENHEQSKKHKDNVKHSDMCEDEIIQKQERREKERPVHDLDISTEEEMHRVIPLEECIFCDHLSEDVDASLVHMSDEHLFFIPDLEYCLSVPDLVEYLVEKVKRYFVCLFCSDSGKEFYSLDAVRKHMHIKGHCRIDDRHMEEYYDFYDYPEIEDMPNDASNDESMEYELVLPNGTVVGHRSLNRYYKQHLNPNRQVVLRDKGHIHKVMDQDKGQQVKQEFLERSVAIRQSKLDLKLGLKANKFPRTITKLL